MSKVMEVVLKVLIGLVLLSVPTLFVYMIYQDDQKCSYRVEMADDEIIECRRVDSYDSGMTWVVSCQGERMGIPTRDIKIVKKVK